MSEETKRYANLLRDLEIRDKRIADLETELAMKTQTIKTMGDAYEEVSVERERMDGMCRMIQDALYACTEARIQMKSEIEHLASLNENKNTTIDGLRARATELETICEINDEKIRTLEAGNGKLREIILGTPCSKCDYDDCKKAVAHYRDLEAEVERLAREILQCPNLVWHLDNGGGRESGTQEGGSPKGEVPPAAANPAAHKVEPTEEA